MTNTTRDQYNAAIINLGKLRDAAQPGSNVRLQWEIAIQSAQAALLMQNDSFPRGLELAREAAAKVAGH